jgi:hypothetical protein
MQTDPSGAICRVLNPRVTIRQGADGKLHVDIDQFQCTLSLEPGFVVVRRGGHQAQIPVTTQQHHQLRDRLLAADIGGALELLLPSDGEGED